MLVKVAWRNVWRQKSRSIIIMLSITAGILAGLFIMAFYNGLREQQINSTIQDIVSHIQLHHPQFKQQFEAKYFIEDGDSILNGIKKNSAVKAATGRIIQRAMISTASGSAGAAVNGIMPDEEDKITGLQEKITKGNYFTQGKKNEIILSEKLAAKLKLRLNSKVVLTLLDTTNTIISGAFRVTGIFKTTNSHYDEANVFVNKNEIGELTGLNSKINEIAVLLHSNDELDPVYTQLKRSYPELLVERWKEIAPEIAFIDSSIDQFIFVFVGIIMLALAFGIINTMMMAVLERTREIGMLMALGMSKPRIFIMILLETFFLVIAGTFAGVLAGTAFALYFDKHGINLYMFEKALSGFGYSEIIFTKLTLHHYIMITELVVVTTILSSLFPARKALSLNPAEAIRK